MRRGGPRGPKPKSATVATRVTAELREAMDRESERTGRSLSAVCEVWLERGRLACALDRKVVEAADHADHLPWGSPVTVRFADNHDGQVQ